MEKIYGKIKENMLFGNIEEKDFSSILSCLGTFEKSFGKNEFIIHEGDSIDFVGIVIEGILKIVKNDYDGNEAMICTVSEGNLFAEVFACAGISHSPVSIVSSTESKVLFFNYGKIITTCSSSCIFHQQLIANMLKVVANKTLHLNARINIISRKTLRDKILTYFQYESKGRRSFTILMNREELAHFLCADRSALSNELSKMQKDGLIEYSKNTFQLKNIC